jgi:hypothetical protein
MPLNRRQFFGLGIACTTVGAALPGAANNNVRPDLSSIFEPNASLTVWWLRGMRYAHHNGRYHPLHGVEQLSFGRRVINAPGSQAAILARLSYATDLDNADTISHYRDPFTGSLLTALQQLDRPVIFHVTEKMNDTRIENPFTSHRTHGKKVIAEYQKMDTTFGNARETRTHIYNVNNRTQEQQRIPWQHPLRGNHTDTHIETYLSGYRITNQNLLPKSILHYARKFHPWVIRDPLDWLNIKVRDNENTLKLQRV